MATATQGPSLVPWYRTRRGALVAACLGVAVLLLLIEHWTHALGALPYLVLLACPLMHFFMHHGHGGHGHRASKPSDEAR